jgi:type I restriction enzyme, S subunit
MGSGGTPSRKKKEFYKNGTIPWLKSGELNNGIVTSAEEFITEEAIKKSSAKIAPKGSLLVAMYGATAGKVGLLDFDSSMNQAVCFIKPDNEQADARYLYYYLMSKNQELLDKREGGGQPNISQTILKSLKIPLPTLSEQKVIVAKLDRAQRLIDIDREMLAKYDELIQSVFLEMFGDPVRNEMGWEVKPFDDMAVFDTNMTSDFEKYGDLLHVGIGNIERDTGKISGCITAKEEGITSGKYLFNEEHIIYSKIRPYLNKVALPNFKGLCSADAYPIKPIKNVTTRTYLTYLLRSESFLDFISKHSTRTNIPKANKSQMKQFEGIVPPIDIQYQFEMLVSQINNEKDKVQISLKKSEELFSSLVKKFFN